MEKIIDIKNLNKKYELSNGIHIDALKNINIEIKKGEIVGILGKSGAGKTTLLRILRGVEPFHQGKIEINGINIPPNSKIKHSDLNKLKKISAIHLQRSFGLWADSVLNNIMRRLNVLLRGNEISDLPDEESEEYKNLMKKAIEILEIVDLQDKKDWFSGILSGGEKQRLVLARQLALAGNLLKILLLDEPITMSCPHLKQVSLNGLKKIIKEHNITTLVTSHLPKVLEYLCDRVILLENGEIKKIDQPEKISTEFLASLPEPIELTPLTKFNDIVSIHDIFTNYYHETLKKAFEFQLKEFSIYEGEILGVIGHSGIGKTIFLRLLAGIETPKKGEILYHFEKPVNLCELGFEAMNARRKISLMHQELDLEYYANVKDLILSQLGLKGESSIYNAKKKANKLNIKENYVDIIHRLGDLPRSEINQKLQELELTQDIIQDLFPIPPWEMQEKLILPLLQKAKLNPELLGRKTSEISGGEKIRLALILKILTKPKILLLDEPFGDLDPITLREITNFLKELNQELGMTIIIASHHHQFVQECAHRIVVLEEKNHIATLGTIANTKEKIIETCNNFSREFY